MNLGVCSPPGRALLAAALCVAMPVLAEPSAPQSIPAPGELWVAWLDAQGELRTAVASTDGQREPVFGVPALADATVPLGSLWKLVAHARLTDAGVPESPYTCRGTGGDEVYCCEPGQRVRRAAALWRSCGPYFAPARIGWPQLPADGALQSLPASMRSLADGDALRSTARVPLRDWLRWLGAWPPVTQQAARADLLGYWLQGPGRAALGEVGSRLRVKTFTVEAGPAAPGTRWAGASGWTSDGTPVWMAARGASANVVPQQAARVLALLDAETERARQGGDASPWHLAASPSPCVDVDFFSRYPLRSLSPSPARDGRLPAGRYQLRFVNGRTLPLQSDGEPIVRRQGGGVALTGRFALDDYIARVIDREGSAQPAAAARALAVAARTYVLANGKWQGGCLRVADSSATQRVSPNPPSAGARAAARDTAELVLHGRGITGRFHATDAREGVMSWADAVSGAKAGRAFDRLLREAYGPAAGLRGLGGADGFAGTAALASDCEPLPQATDWLHAQQPRWRRALLGEAGYRTPAAVQVCRLQQGRPHALRASGRIYAAGWSGVQSLEERLTLAHEYLHLAFDGHPRGRDEGFIERRARQLLGVMP